MNPEILKECQAALLAARRALWNDWHDKPRIGAESAVEQVDRALASLARVLKPQR